MNGGLDGILALGTTGEGILLSVAERCHVAERFLDAAGARLAVVVHCGAQTTAQTVELCRHAAGAGASGVAVIAPPYFPLDDEALLAHLETAAAACAPTPFYLYEFARTSGYPVPPQVIERLRERAPNLAGLKVSDSPWESFQPYLIEGLDVFVGPEALIHRGIEAGAIGAVSALATAFPELVVEAVREPSAEAAARLAELRAAVETLPRHAALKAVLGLRGVSIREDVRRPLRCLREEERGEVERIVREFGP